MHKKQVCVIAVLTLSMLVSCQTDTSKANHPVVNDSRLVANPKVRFVGPREHNPFINTNPANLTEDNCKKQGCTVVVGSGPAYATWCGCGSGKDRNYTYIHS
jgi:hypothetical protein